MLQLLLGSRSDAQAQAVIGEHLQRFDVVDGFPRHQRMDAAGVVADHSADCAVGVGGRIGAECEVVLLGLAAKIVEDDAWFDRGVFLFRIELEDAMHILREIEYDSDVAALTGQRCSTASGQDRCAELSGQGDSGNHVVRITRQHDADGYLPIVRGVSRVHGAGAVIEPNLSPNLAAERGGQGGGVDVHGLDPIGVLELCADGAVMLERNRIEARHFIALRGMGGARRGYASRDLALRH